eukprot:CAMPEP_0197548768 /NCGR_PEP_ID=MMETSP1320-20131121/2813_1 /TAXON_ID=91990 /ORGANISM="Bolidomonas sp., Strain RCC2347" /LENGTH=180 /DNA_ID=CAMNT_0043108849 /DNA_START=77 /DNA_END=615 /DNA_ORIENTATION=+
MLLAVIIIIAACVAFLSPHAKAFLLPPASFLSPTRMSVPVRRIPATTHRSSADDWANQAMSNAVDLDSLSATPLDDMRASELKRELTLRGVDTSSFFEKSELKERLKTARDNDERSFQQSAPSSSTPPPPPPPPPSDRAEYRDVQTQKMNSDKPRAGGGVGGSAGGGGGGMGGMNLGDIA